MSVLLSLPSAEGKRFRRYSGAAAGGDLRLEVSVQMAAFGGRGIRRPAEGKEGMRHRMVSYPPLHRPFLGTRLPSVARLKMRGAHRGVWCSKGQRLIEAELFATERCRPAPSGRALLCAAVPRKLTSGPESVPKGTDARNRASVTPVSLHISDVSAQREGLGESRGGKGTMPLPPFVSAARRR